MNEAEMKKNKEADLATEEQKPKKKSGGHLTTEEKLERIAQQQRELAARARKLRAMQNTKERKARAHRLIKVGAVVEAVYGAAMKGDEVLRALEKFLKQQNERGSYFSDAIKKGEAELKAREEEERNAEAEHRATEEDTPENEENI